jgi:hypothetical protein
VLYGDHKVRDMARSILPLTRDPSLWEDGAEDERDHSHGEIEGMVSRRRGADKLNHFERWAVELTREMPVEARLGYLAGVLPPGLIGEHAMSHLERRPELAPDLPRRVWRKRKSGLLDRGEMAMLLRRLLEVHNGHRAFNAALKHAVVDVPLGRLSSPALRVLHGAHDVLAFLAALDATPADPRRIVADRFLRRFKASGDPIDALMRSTPVRLDAQQLWLLQHR